MSDPKLDAMRWPKPGDQPFRSGSQSSRIALDMHWARSWLTAPDLYIAGYKKAACLLFESLSGRASEMLVFPYLFLWRQHVELSLKRLILLAQELKDIDDKPPHGHRLPRLWLTLRALLEADEELADEVRVSFDAADAVIGEIERVDPNSIHSRYAEGFTTDHQVESLVGLPRGFDIAHFHDVVSSLSNLFECIDMEYSQRLDSKMEMLALARDRIY